MQALNDLQAPDALALSVSLSDGSVLDLQTAVRVVPKKRVVAQGEWHHKTVYAKLFLGELAQRYARRDAKGVRALQANAIKTPELLFEGQVAQAAECDIEVLIFTAHTTAENAETLYVRANAVLKKVLAIKLVKAVAQLHQAQLLQTDLYFKNFLIDQGEVLTIDGDGIRQYATLTNRQKQDNLAIFLSKIDALDLQAWLPELIKAYQAVTQTSVIDSTALLALANKYRIRAASQYADKKVFRECTDIQCVQDQHRFVAIARDYVDMPIPDGEAEYDAAVNGGQWLKKGNTCSVVFAQIAPLPVVIKRYNIKSLKHALARFWRPSRASDSWSNAHRLLNLGLSTPQPIALFETRFLKVFRGKAFFVSRYLDAPDIEAFFSQTNDAGLRSEAIKQVVKLFMRLQVLKLSHGDMKATNIKMLADGKPVLIDLDSMRQHQYAFFAKKAHVRDIKRFMQNWQAQPALYNAFLKNFKVLYQDHALLDAAGLLEAAKKR